VQNLSIHASTVTVALNRQHIAAICGAEDRALIIGPIKCAIPESARRASIGRNTMNEIDREEALSLLIKNCGLTESEAKACLRNPLVTMLIIPILERLNRIESRLNQK
jgi:hypothetical protein